MVLLPLVLPLLLKLLLPPYIAISIETIIATMSTTSAPKTAAIIQSELEITQKSYDSFSEQYAQTWGANWESEDKLWIDEFLAKLPQNASVIDVGCGTGHILQYCAAHGHQVTGIDVSQGMLSQAKIQVPQAKLVQMPADSLTFSNNSFDGLISRYVLQHLTQVDVAFSEFYRVLKPGGYAYVVIHVSNTDSLDESWYTFPNGGGKIKMNYHAPADVLIAVKSSGFSIEKKALLPDGKNRNYFFLLHKE